MTAMIIKIPKRIEGDSRWNSPEYKSSTRKRFGIFPIEVPPLRKREEDSRSLLEELGFKIVREPNPFNPNYECEFPKELPITEEGYWITICHPDADICIFDKYSIGDTRCFVTFSRKEKTNDSD